MSRKTFPVEDLTAEVNAMLALSAEDRRQGRQALALLLESVLMDTDNYRGFMFTDASGRGETDDSRRRYH